MTDRAQEPRRQHEPGASDLRRHLAVLFTDLSDSTRLSGAMEAELYADVLEAVRLVFIDCVAKRRGVINQFQGDGLQAVFGFPIASEQDGRIAAEAALEVHERVRALPRRYALHGASGLSVHSGLHAGLVLARQGDTVAGRLELFGPTPGIAKHLSDVARDDEILVSDETLGPAGLLFETAARRQVMLKGRLEPLWVYRILARSTVRTRFEAHTLRGLAPFIGRRDELRRLDEALNQTLTGRLSFLAISAPAGTGKTRLAEEFLRRASAGSCSVSRGYCESDLSAEPLQPFLQMLRARLQLHPDTSASEAALAIEQGLAAIDRRLLVHTDLLLQALSFDTDEHEGRPSKAVGDPSIWCELFAAMARTEPQVVFIDDWQWADDATRQVVFAMRELTDLPILLLLATRPVDRAVVDLMNMETIALAPFGKTEAEKAIGERLPHADPFVADAIRRYAGGNPLFIEELCHSAAVSGGSATPQPVQGGSAWLETMIEARVARLPPTQRQILSAAAVIGNVVPAWLLQRITARDEHDLDVTALAGQDLLFPVDRGGMFRFKHGITRDVVYGAIGLQQRRSLHREVAQLLLARGEVKSSEALAHHFAGAGMLPEAIQHAEAAGDRAVSASSIDRAKAHYCQALDMIDQLPAAPERYLSWRSIARRLGLVCVFDPSRGDLQVFERAIELARIHEDDAGLAYAEYWLAYLYYALGESREAVAHCRLALVAASRLGDAQLVGQVHAILGQTLAAAAEYEEALGLLGEAAASRRAAGSAHRPLPGLAYSLACKASVLGDTGRFDDAYACFDEAIRALPAAGHEVEGSVLCWRSGVGLWQGRWDAARKDAMAAKRVAARVKSLYLFAMSHGLAAYAKWQLDRSRDSLDALIDSASWLQAHDKRLFISLVHGWLAEALAQTGRIDDARRHAARALQRTRHSDWIGIAMASRALAGVAAGRGDPSVATRLLRHADRAATHRGSAHEAARNDMSRAELAFACGSREAALAALDRAMAAFERMQMRPDLARAVGLRQSL